MGLLPSSPLSSPLNLSSGPRPGLFSFEGRAKYDAWARVASEYDGRVEDAKVRYVEIAKSAGWNGSDEVSDETATPKKGGGGGMGFGPSVSMLEREEESG